MLETCQQNTQSGAKRLTCQMLCLQGVCWSYSALFDFVITCRGLQTISKNSFAVFCGVLVAHAAHVDALAKDQG